ncbi:MAG: glycosyltransferase family 2 protein [Deltaproteobacteria bacterium]
MKGGALPGNMKVSVVMPVYNERPCIEDVIKRVVATGMTDELIIVDDSSTDGTREILVRLKDGWKDIRPCLKLLFNERNMGKGAALRLGFSNITGSIVIVQDADLEYDPADYPRLLRPILEGKADVVYGSRFLGESHRVLFFWHMLGNKFLTFLSNLFSNLNLTDLET